MTDLQLNICAITIITITAMVTMIAAIRTALNYAIKFNTKQADTADSELKTQIKLAELQAKAPPNVTDYDHEQNPEIINANNVKRYNIGDSENILI